ncbi:MAG TPA: hypothetical protein VN256_01445 [Pyrinomonadaceae bacterium]|nr:hypothetical protein [Pyrinomonadaceae bacterium]
MRNPKRILSAALFFALAALPALAVAQQSVGALERGYRTGYSDGYQAGYRDSANRAARDYRDEDDYQRADRAYATSYGSLEDYRDGYQQGFEVGYDAGFDRRGFDSTIPQNISRRGTADPQGPSGQDDDDDDPFSSSSSTGGSTSSGPVSGPVNTSNITFIPAGTEMRVELLTNLSTDATQKGDRFEARVVGPPEYQGAMIEGHVSRVKRAGKVKGNSELQLTFDKISTNGRWTEFRAQVVEIEDTGRSEGVGEVDEEGGVKGRDRTKDDIAKVGAGAGVGAIIGAIFGGGKGAAIGAVLGGAVGTGGVLTSRGKDIRLEHGQYLRIRTANETRF